MGIKLKNIYITLLHDAEQFYVKKQDGGRIKICETFSRNSLREDLSIDTTFDPCYFLWDSPFKSASLLTKQLYKTISLNKKTRGS